MKKLIVSGLMMFGAMLVTAQVTPQQDTTTTRSERKMKKMDQKSQESIQPNGMNRTIDTTRQNQNNNRTQPKTTTKQDSVWNKSQPATR